MKDNKNDIRQIFRNNLIKLRNEANMTQEELSEKSGISRGTIGRWESKGGNPNMDYIFKMADAMNINPITFFGDM